ncbi:MAG TPA: c-type cytochrome [Campylobacterales bacterium]|nr:c-type cytochrome [Campylobacterales bacterium]HHH51242.1 c-type cytochrome [Campylobacterales bacterium]
MIKKLFLILPLTLLANDNNSTKTKSGELLYIENSCNACHGNYGEGMGSAPRLIGQKEEVLLKRLKALQKGKTISPFGGIMVSFAKSLDENETIEMSKYLSKLKKVENPERYDNEYDPSDDGSS